MAKVERDGVTYASAAIGHAGNAVYLRPERRIPPGRYTLVLTGTHGTSRRAITID
jgi:hypothetical protein